VLFIVVVVVVSLNVRRSCLESFERVTCDATGGRCNRPRLIEWRVFTAIATPSSDITTTTTTVTITIDYL
jgi:hypothetical protein